MVKVQEGGCKVYKFDGLATFECVDELKDAGWQKVDTTIHLIEKPVIFVCTPIDYDLDIYSWDICAYPNKDGACWKATIFKNDKFSIKKILYYHVPGMPYTPDHYVDGGPDTHKNVYGDRRRFFCIKPLGRWFGAGTYLWQC